MWNEYYTTALVRIREEKRFRAKIKRQIILWVNILMHKMNICQVSVNFLGLLCSNSWISGTLNFINKNSLPTGGVVTAGLAIYDTMQYILNPISTWCVGQAASMGSLLLAAGTAGMRHSLPNARVMIHQPSGGARVSYIFKINFKSRVWDVKEFFFFEYSCTCRVRPQTSQSRLKRSWN